MTELSSKASQSRLRRALTTGGLGIHRLTLVALAAGALVACASPSAATGGPTSLTAADVAAEPKEAAPAAAPTGPDRPAGQLVCKAQSLSDGTTELYLEWSGTAAKGTLRRVAPSGNVEDKPVKAERYKDMVVADEPTSLDLVDHAATVRAHEGKQYIRLGGYKGGWTACE